MATFKSKLKYFQSLQPIDRSALILILSLTIAIASLTLGSSLGGLNSVFYPAPRVRNFSWEGKQIGAEDKAFILTFSRPMDHESVQKNFRIEPPLLGKFSWVDKRMAYTLLSPAPYGTTYSVHLQDAQEQLSGQKNEKIRPLIKPFTGYFRTRDRAFAYIGLGAKTEGKLMLINLSSEKPEPMILTPPELIVIDYQPYPKGDRILFSAIPRHQERLSFLHQELYTVTTGLNLDPSLPSQPAGKIEKILDSKNYQNVKFDLSADGRTIVVQRANIEKPSLDTGFWLIRDNNPPERMQNEKGETQKGGNFLIAPDSNSLVMLQGQGIAIVPLEKNAETIAFLPQFGEILNFSKDGAIAAFIKYNTDNTRSLFIVNNEGTEKEILRTKPFENIISVEFDATKTLLYCLMTQLVPVQENKTLEQPYIAAINLQEGTLKPLLILPNKPHIKMSLSPDGLLLLFDQEVKLKQPLNSKNEAIRPSGTKFNNSTSQLWLLPVDQVFQNKSTLHQPESLPFLGFQPRWLP